MNYSIIIYIIGMILKIEAVFMALPAITALIYQETSGVAFLITIALCPVSYTHLKRARRFPVVSSTSADTQLGFPALFGKSLL